MALGTPTAKPSGINPSINKDHALRKPVPLRSESPWSPSPFFIGACGGNPIEHDAVFATQSPDNGDLVDTATGDVLSIFVLVGFLLSDAQTTCPSIETSGNVVTITGGCSDSDGDRFEGSARLENVGAAYDSSKLSRVVYNDFSIQTDSDRVLLDGEVTLPSQGQPSAKVSFDALVESQGKAIEMIGSFSCDPQTERCSWSKTSASLSGTGGFGLEGSWQDEPESAPIALKGANEMTIDLNANTAGCVSVAVEGETELLCGEQELQIQSSQQSTSDASLSVFGLERPSWNAPELAGPLLSRFLR